MTKKILSATSFLILTLLFTAPAQSQTPVTTTPEWKAKMQSLYQSLAALLTDVCSDQRFNDPKNATRIEREIKSLSGFSQEMNKISKDSPKSDPTLKLFSGLLASETDEAYRSFRANQKDYARDILKSIPSDCLACHSRNTLGPDFNSLPIEPNATLKPSEHAEFLAATRQFDRAMDAFQLVLRGDAKPKSDPYDLEKTAHEALTIAVRFKRDPVLAGSVIQSLLDNELTPRFLKDDATQWKASVNEWKAEPHKEIKTEEGMHAEALRLMGLAKSNQAYAMDHSQDVYYLRASTLLYDLVQSAPTGKYVSDSLLLLGMCYEVLNPRRMENLHNIYYEACIQNSPHTEIARTCYRRYEQSMYFGFTGSSGTHLPEKIKEKLLELWGQAMPKKGDL